MLRFVRWHREKWRKRFIVSKALKVLILHKIEISEALVMSDLRKGSMVFAGKGGIYYKSKYLSSLWQRNIRDGSLCI